MRFIARSILPCLCFCLVGCSTIYERLTISSYGKKLSENGSIETSFFSFQPFHSCFRGRVDYPNKNDILLIEDFGMGLGPGDITIMTSKDDDAASSTLARIKEFNTPITKKFKQIDVIFEETREWGGMHVNHHILCIPRKGRGDVWISGILFKHKQRWYWIHTIYTSCFKPNAETVKTYDKNGFWNQILNHTSIK